MTLIAEFTDGPAKGLRVDRAAAFWAAEPFAVALMHDDAGVLAYEWLDKEPSDRDWTYKSALLTAHLYRLDNEQRAGGERTAEYRHERALLGS